jgi:hypothetical protein
MFNDGDDNEQSTALVSAIQFRDVALTDEEVAALGGPTAGGPPLTGASAESCAPLGALQLATELLSADAVTGPYTVQAGATINATAKTITVPITTRVKFYRIRSSAAVTIRTVTIQGANLVLSYQ